MKIRVIDSVWIGLTLPVDIYIYIFPFFPYPTLMLADFLFLRFYFYLNFHFSMAVDIKYYISFSWTAQQLDIYMTYEVTSLTSLHRLQVQSPPDIIHSNTILLIVFPVLYFTSSRLLCSCQLVLFNLLTFFTLIVALIYILIEFIGVTLVNKIIQAPGVQFYNASSYHLDIALYVHHPKLISLTYLSTHFLMVLLYHKCGFGNYKKM